MHSLDDTIAAIATARAGAARGIVRVSGADAIAIVQRIFLPAEPTDLMQLRLATRVSGAIVVPLAGRAETQSLPCDLYLWPTERSYTRQPVAELHAVGSPPLVDAVLRAVCSAGLRLAEPGEFTLRAFLAGRIDLVQAEAVLGVIDAADRRQLDTALVQLAGGLTRPLHALRDDLLNLLADLEAGLDFVEEDIRFLTAGELERRLAKAAELVARVIEQMQFRGRADGDPRVVLVGLPNVGKSSLFNALATNTAALISETPGTTRDYLAARLDLDGTTCLLIDTAGQEADDGRETITSAAQRMMQEQREAADLQLLCLDSSRSLTPWQRGQLPSGDRQLRVLTKCDVPVSYGQVDDAIATSAMTGRGLAELRCAIRSRLLSAVGEASPSGAVAATAIRCGEGLRLAAQSIERARDIARGRGGDEFIAAEIRAALGELGKVIGAIYTDDLLDRVFSRFCIGK